MEASGVKDAILSGMNDDESSYVSHTDQLLSLNFHHAFYFLMTPAFS
jgi:hypothetical protein